MPPGWVYKFYFVLFYSSDLRESLLMKMTAWLMTFGLLLAGGFFNYLALLESLRRNQSVN